VTGSSGTGCRPAVATAAVVLLLAIACTRTGTGPQPARGPGAGTALAATAASSSSLTLPPGQEVIEVGAALRNDSDAPLEMTKLRVAGARGVPAVAEVVRMALVDPGSIDASGVFVTFPPVTRRDEACVRAKVFPARGAVLDPEESPLILVWIRSVAAGRARVRALNVTYEQGDDLFQQTVDVDGAVVIDVRDGATALKPSADERACASRVQLLPGAVQI
jgi:hypothetical protein